MKIVYSPDGPALFIWEILEVNKEAKNYRKEVKTPYPINNGKRT